MDHCCHDDAKNSVDEGFYLMLEGICKVTNHEDGYCSKRLKRSEFFGESDILKIIGFDFFGDVVAETDVKCYFISRDHFNKIPLFE